MQQPAHPYKTWHTRLTLKHASRTHRSPQRSKRRFCLEPLESRIVLNGDVVISEIGAVNENGLRDYDDDRSDWVELLNTTGVNIDIQGWYLTDDVADLTKWQVPVSTVLNADDHLVVFASGKNIVMPEGELHTNFKLANDPSYLALIEEDGTTISWETSPDYPQQFPDISYGTFRGLTTTTHVSSSNPGNVLVPQHSNDLPANWNDPTFQSTAWQNTSMSVGFDRLTEASPDDFAGLRLWLKADDIVDGPEPTNGTSIHLWQDHSGNGHNATNVTDMSTSFTAPTRTETTVSLPDGDKTFPVVRFGFADELLRASDIMAAADTHNEANENENFSELTILTVYATTFPSIANRPIGFGLAASRGGQNVDNFLLTNDPSIQKGNGGIGSGQYGQALPTTFFVRSTVMTDEDGIFLSLKEYFNGTLVMGSSDNFAVRSDNFYLGDTTFAAGFPNDVAEVIIYDRALDNEERTRVEEHLRLKYLQADATAPTSDGPYADIFDTDLVEQMQRTNASAFLRTEFDVADPSEVDRLTLRMKYDDGFIAYLNGTAVAAQNAPAMPQWNSNATLSRPDEAALEFEGFDLTAHIPLLQASDNVLAIHGMNISASDVDFLIIPELTTTVNTIMEDQFFAPPTPGTANDITGDNGVMLSPDISIESTMFSGSISVGLTTTQANAEIRYTTNGSLPVATSKLYQTPLIITSTTQVRARTFGEDHIPSKTASETYVKLGSSAQTFSSNLPVMVIDTFKRNPSTSGFTSSFMATFEPTADGRTRLTNAPQTYSRSGVKVRGASTSGYAKKQYGLELREQESDEDRNLSLFGLPAESDWVLNAPFRADPALTRTRFMYSLSNQMGQYAPRTQYVELFVNKNGGDVTYPSDYMGVYVLVEKIKRSNERTDIEKISTKYTTEPEITGGYILKIDLRDPGDNGFRSSRGLPSNGNAYNHVYPKEDNLNGEQSSYIRNYFEDFEDALYGPNMADPDIGYAAYIDVDSFIDGHVINELSLNVDGLLRSTYFHKPKSGKLTMGPLWDQNITMGADDFHDRDENPFVWYGDRFFDWWSRLLLDKNFQQKWIDRYQELRESVFSLESMLPQIDELAAMVEEAQVRNVSKWPIHPPRSGGGLLNGTWEGEVAYHKDWLTKRVGWLDNKFLDRPIFDNNGGAFSNPITLNISKPSGATVYYTKDGSDPRASGGSIANNAIKYTGPITIDDDAVIFARSYDPSFNSSFVGNTEPWSGSRAATFMTSTPTVKITEINYHPNDPTATELAIIPGLDDNDFEFIELQNTGETTVNLADIKFTNGIDFVFPFIELSAHQRVVVARNAEAFQIRYGSDITIAGEYSQGLSNAGESIHLVDAFGTTIQNFSYDDTDQWPQSADGIGATLELIDPLETPDEELGKHYRWRGSTAFGGSPGTAGSDPLGVVINEVLTRSDPSAPELDSIELLNTTIGPINIGGWFLSDSGTNPLKYQIPADTTLAAGETIVFNETHFNPTPLIPQPHHFALSGTLGDDVWLVVPDGTGGVASLVDDVHFEAASVGESFGRVGDGSGSLVPMTQVTLGALNSAPRVGPIIISEVNYNPEIPASAALTIDPNLTSDDLEFVEIFNPTATMVDLTQWRLRGGVDFDFPDGTMLAAGGTLLVISFNPTSATNVDRLAAFKIHYQLSADISLLGGYQGQLSNSAERLVLQRAGNPPAEAPTVIPRLWEDELLYDDLPPWPTSSDGEGNSLQRISTNTYGNDSSSWTANPPSPGAFSGSLPGDFNADQMVDGADIDLLFATLQEGAADLLFDVDESGTVTSADVTFLVVTLLGTNFGDTDLDGDIDTGDLTQAIIHFTSAGGEGKSWSDGDNDGDGDVDTGDLTTAIINFTSAMNTTTVAKTSGSWPIIILSGARATETPALDGDGNTDALATAIIHFTEAVDTTTLKRSYATSPENSSLGIFHRRTSPLKTNPIEKKDLFSQAANEDPTVVIGSAIKKDQ